MKDTEVDMAAKAEKVRRIIIEAYGTLTEHGIGQGLIVTTPEIGELLTELGGVEFVTHRAILPGLLYMGEMQAMLNMLNKLDTIPDHYQPPIAGERIRDGDAVYLDGDGKVRRSAGPLPDDEQ